MSESRIKVGIIGLGRAGWGMHAKELESFKDLFEITASCDIDSYRTDLMRNHFGQQLHSYTNYQDLIADKDVELVAIACRSKEHARYAMEALDAGKYVVLDKPIAMNYADAQKLLAYDKKYPNHLFCRQNRRFERGFNHVLEIMDSGILGEIYLVSHSVFSYQRRNDWQTISRCGGGQLNNWGPHLLDHGIQLVGSRIKNVTGWLRRVTAVGDAEDFFKLVLEGENGRLVDVQFSGGAALATNAYEVYGKRGSLILPQGGNAQIQLKYLDPEIPLMNIEADPSTPSIGGLDWKPYRNPETLHWIEKSLPVQPSTDDDINTIYRHVYNAIRKNIPYRVKTEESVEVIRVADILRQQNPEFLFTEIDDFPPRG